MNLIDYKKIKVNDVAKYSMTRPFEANQIVNIIKQQLLKINKDPKDCIITDGTCGVGGDTLHFSQHFKYVNSVDILFENSNLLYENCKFFNITNVNIITNNFLNIHHLLNHDILYLDPPWGGVNYKNENIVNIKLDNLNMLELINKIKLNFNENLLFFIKVPLNVDMNFIPFKDKYIIYNKRNIPTFFLINIRWQS